MKKTHTDPDLIYFHDNNYKNSETQETTKNFLSNWVNLYISVNNGKIISKSLLHVTGKTHTIRNAGKIQET